MKTIISRTATLALVIGLVSTSAFASFADRAGQWTGAGRIYGADGKETGQFLVSLTNTLIDEDTIETQGSVTYADGKNEPFWQRMRSRDNDFSLESAHGDGAAYCFGDGLCQGYIGTRQSGSAIAITLDGRNNLRILVTELQEGKAQGFVEEKLHRTK